MRLLAALACAAALMCGPVLAQTAPQDHLGFAGPVSFRGQDFVFAWSSRPSDTYAKHEYLPQGQDANSYTDMFLIEAVAGALTPSEAAAAQAQLLEARRAEDPVANFEIIRNEASGEVLLDFVISDLSADPILVEWNAYRYTGLAAGGVALFGVSRRGYGEDGARSLLETLGGLRQDDINALATHDLPTLLLSN